MHPRIEYVIIVAFLVACAAACSPTEEVHKNDRTLAKVYGKPLYQSELDEMFAEGSTREDSVQIINAFVERWAHENILMHEAEKNIPKDLNIDKLVRDYRASLIRSNYEKTLVETSLDSTITPRELDEFYQKNKDQYQLETPIIRCYLVKVLRNAGGLDDMIDWWNHIKAEGNFRKLVEYCGKHAKIYMLDEKAWYRVEDLSAALPTGTISVENIPRNELTLKDARYQYFFKVLETVNKKEIAPFSYIQDQAVKYILHRRKQKLLESKVTELYQKELEAKNIEIF